MPALHVLGLGSKEARAWAMYDWANSAFATTIMAAFLPIYYAQVAAAELPAQTATAHWGYTTAIALAIIAVLSPILGAIADYLGAKKRFLAGFMGFGVTFTALLALIGEGDWLLASAIFIWRTSASQVPTSSTRRCSHRWRGRRSSTAPPRQGTRWATRAAASCWR